MFFKDAPSLGQKLIESKFRPTGFDYLRIVLAISVVICHTAQLAEGDEAREVFSHRIWPYVLFILPAFFTLSGFLVAGSMERSRTLINFLGLRVLRIYPALIVEVFLSALIIGPIVTELPLQKYFTSPVFWRYLVNVTGHISFYLPGVFTHNPGGDKVNGQLWTVPWELGCYISLAGLIIFGLKRNRYLVLAGIGLVAGLSIAKEIIGHHGHVTPLQSYVPGIDLILYFLCGVAGYLFRNEIPWSPMLGTSALILGGLLLWFAPGGQYFAALPVVYATIFLGLCNPKRLPIGPVIDSSYGVYLYGYPIQQFVAWAFPFTHVWYLNALFAIPLSIAFGICSWYAVERPALNLRDKLKSFEDWWLAKRSQVVLAVKSGTKTPMTSKVDSLASKADIES